MGLYLLCLLLFYRCYVSVVSLNGHIYAMGGSDGHTRQNTAERYDKNRNQWSLIQPMHQQRSDASAANLNGKCGGGGMVVSFLERMTQNLNKFCVILSRRYHSSMNHCFKN